MPRACVVATVLFDCDYCQLRFLDVKHCIDHEKQCHGLIADKCVGDGLSRDSVESDIVDLVASPQVEANDSRPILKRPTNKMQETDNDVRILKEIPSKFTHSARNILPSNNVILTNLFHQQSIQNPLPMLESEPNTAYVNQSSIIDQSYHDPPFEIMDVKIRIPEVDAKSLSSDKFNVKEAKKLNDEEASFGIETVHDDDDDCDLFREKYFIQIFKNDPFASGMYECRTCHRIIKCRANDNNALKRHLRAKICQRKSEILSKVQQKPADPLSLLSIETNKSNANSIENSESTDNRNKLEAGPSKRAKTNCKYQCPIADCDFSDLCRESVISHTKEQHLCGGDTWVLEPISIDLTKPMLTDLSQFQD